MKKKLMRMPKVVTILVAVLIVAIFLGSMDVAAFFLADTVSLPGYGSSMIAEFMAGVVAFLLLCLFGYLGVLGEKAGAQIPALFAENVYQTAVFRRWVQGQDFGLIDPGVTPEEGGLALGRDGAGGIGSLCSHSRRLLI